MNGAGGGVSYWICERYGAVFGSRRDGHVGVTAKEVRGIVGEVGDDGLSLAGDGAW